MASNKNSKKSAYSSEIEKYMNEQGVDENDSNFLEESSFQSSKIKSSKLDDYLGLDEEEEEEKVNHCSICGAELKKFNYGDKCDDCVKKVELVNDLNQLLEYTSPSEELEKDVLLNAGFDEPKWNILISNLLSEKLITLGMDGIFLSDVKRLNKFFKIYGSDSDILDESLYKKSIFSDDFVDLAEFSDLVQIKFNYKNKKWEVNFIKSHLRKYFHSITDANNHASRYLNELGEIDELREKQLEPQNVKYRRSKHEFVFFSVKRNCWYVKVKGHVKSKFVGFYDTEEEAVIARDEYIQKKRENQAKLKPKKFHKNESDALISFDKKYELWVVKVKTRKGGFKKLGYYDTEQEAIDAKNEYYGIVDESGLTKGNRVQVISGDFEGEIGVIQGFFESRESFIVKFDNPEFDLPLLFKEDQLKLI
ncbi:hypothetical protein [Methanobrevibacter sp.]|uniref:hypothetical protein n=1 Tax=Methanobrevibacter sp. TaxID=66852 RepID=UPI003975EF13